MRRLPDHDVAHQRRSGRQVAADRREVERGDRVDEPLERPVIHPVPGQRPRLGLFLIEPLGEVHVEPPEVDQLTGTVDLGLKRGLALTQHGGRVDLGPPGTGQQVGRLEENRRPILEPGRLPVLPRLARRVDRRLDGGGVGLMGPRQHSTVVVGAHHIVELPGPDLLAPDHHRDLDRLPSGLAQRSLERRSLGRSGSVAEHWFIVNAGKSEATHDAHRAEEAGTLAEGGGMVQRRVGCFDGRDGRDGRGVNDSHHRWPHIGYPRTAD